MSEPQHGHDTGSSPYTESEHEAFLRDDQGIFRTVAIIISAILLIGVALYTVIAWITSAGV
jgi:hypothetical protein